MGRTVSTPQDLVGVTVTQMHPIDRPGEWDVLLRREDAKGFYTTASTGFPSWEDAKVTAERMARESGAELKIHGPEPRYRGAYMRPMGLRS